MRGFVVQGRLWYSLMATRGSILPDERRRMIAQLMRQHGSVSVSGLEQELGIS